jgi:hypothetical protein
MGVVPRSALLRSILIFGFLNASMLFAQLDIHKFDLQEVSFVYIPRIAESRRCLQWGSLEDKHPTLEYNSRGEVYLRARVTANLGKNCPVKAEPTSLVKLESTSGNFIEVNDASSLSKVAEGFKDDDGKFVFEFTVIPPISRFHVKGPGFDDDVLLEAPVKKTEEANFYSFFKRSQASFDTRYSVLKTDNTQVQANKRSLKVFPVLGGHLSIPLPWIKRFYFGLEMFQNLSNLLDQNDSQVTYSEVALEMGWQWLGKETSGRPRISLLLDARGRNNVQRSDSANLSLTFAFAPGAGIDAMWFPGVIMSRSNFWQKLGVETNFRYYPASNNNQRSYESMIYAGGLMMRLDKKWALGLGYSQTDYTLDFRKNLLGGTQPIVKESIQTIYLRLHLVPYLFEDGQ